VLIVDDDRLLAATLREMISDFGAFELGAEIGVEVVTSGREAAHLLAGPADPDYDVIICDLSMPGVDGLALYEGLAARGSPLARRFVLVTGGAFTPAAAVALALHAPPLLQKPFGAERLAEMLRTFL
jgi:CheY-like chemotaxis protein